MTQKMNKLMKLLFVLYIACLLFLCFGKFDNTGDVPMSLLGIPTDKIVHFCMFFPFPILAFFAFDRFTDTVRSTLLFTGITFCVGILIALGTEWGQARLTTYRSGDSLDLLADAIALALSTLLVIFIDIRKQKK